MRQGISTYFGITSIITAIGAIIGLGIWCFKVIVGQTHFSFGILIFVIIIIAIFGFLGYGLLKLGNEQHGDN